MRFFSHLPVLAALASTIAPIAAQPQKRLARSARIQSAKSVYFEDKTGVDAVGNKALAQLKRWGRFQIVKDRKQADLIFILSADPYKGGYIIASGGQTGTVENGHIDEDRVPNYNKQAPVRYVFLTVLDPKTGDTLWSDSHRWGGLLTGFNTAGERLIKNGKSNQEIDRLANDWSPVGAFSGVGHYVPDSYPPSKTPFGRPDSESRSQIRPELFFKHSWNGRLQQF